MARPIDEFILAWNSLVGAAEGGGWRTIAMMPAGVCYLRAGRRYPENIESLLVGFPVAEIPACERLPEGQGFLVERVDTYHDRKTWVALTRKASGSMELFVAMICDVSGALDAVNGADEHRPLRTFLGRVRAWQEFMRKGAQVLSPEAEIGLIGELAVLATILQAGVPAAPAIESWVGPLDGIQDFELGMGALEVKATLSSTGFPARIGSLEQLSDSVRQPLFVAGVRLHQTSGGQNLSDFIGGLREALKGDAEAEGLLAERLLAGGYFEAHADRYCRRFVLCGIRVIEVGSGFPRLIPGNVPFGVLRAMYEIDLDNVPGENPGVAGALRKLGVL